MKIKENYRKLYKLFYALIVNIVWVTAFYIIFGQDISYLKFSLLCCLMSSVLIFFLFSKVGQDRPSVVFFFIYVICLYFELSMVRFPAQLYAGFVSDPSLRIKGDVIVFISVILAILFCKTSLNIQSEKFLLNMDDSERFIGWLICLSLLIYYIYYFFSNPVSAYVSGIQDNSVRAQLKTLLMDLFQGLCIFFAVEYWNKKWLHKIPCFIVMCAILIRTLFGGGRFFVITTFLIIIYLLIFLGKLNISWLWNIYLYGPFGVIMVTFMTFLISGRREITQVAGDIQYRTCLTDFPITILENTSYFRIDLSQWPEAVKMCIPSVFGIEKNIYAYKNILQSVGLDPNADYTDTVYSLGGIMFGIVGMILCVVIIGWIYSKVESFIISRRISSSERFFLYVLFIKTIVYIELSLEGWLPIWRNFILIMMLGVLVYNIFSKLKIYLR